MVSYINRCADTAISVHQALSYSNILFVNYTHCLLRAGCSILNILNIYFNKNFYRLTCTLVIVSVSRLYFNVCFVVFFSLLGKEA